MGKKIAIAAATALFFIVLAGLLSPDAKKTRYEQVMDGCEREFGDRGRERVNECAIQILGRELEEQEQAKMDRAAG